MGHTRAVTALGSVINSRSNVTGGFLREKHSEETLVQFRKGLEGGDPIAAYALGRQLLRYGQDHDDRDEGYELLLQAYEVGFVEALNELGYFFLLDGHAYTDNERGLRYLDGSAARDNINGLHTLGLAYLGKLGAVAPDVPRAVDYLVRAAEGGHPIAPTFLGRIYAEGDGIRADAVKAVGWFDTGLSRGDPWGGTNAANVIFRDRPAGYTAYDGAVRAAKAAVLANPDASQQARRLLEQLPDRVLDGAAQQLLAELGQSVAVDGAFGSGSERAYRAILSETPEMGVASAPLPRLLTLARAHWARTSFRVDLF
jgi:TPR repeat protein